jgi:hypothetical protein
MAKKKPNSNDLNDQSMVLSSFATLALMNAERMGVQNRSVGDFPLDEAEIALVADLPGVPVALRKKLKAKTSTLTVANTANIVMAMAESLLEVESLEALKLPPIAEKLTDHLQAILLAGAPIGVKAKKSKLTDKVYQFKITLLGSQPTIWRRIQVQNCTLDKLHEHIQTAMGWTNSHLHQFHIKGELYGDPELLDDGFDDFPFEDSTEITLGQILPKTGRRFAFKYEYDFGDGWEHEVLFEGSLIADTKLKYPLCVEGERACPPEDCGGVWGYRELLEAIRDPQHEQHEDLLKWIGSRFDSEKFDPQQATKKMKKGLPNWRKFR